MVNMHKKTSSPYFVGWKATFQRWGWYLLASILLWSILGYLINGYIPFAQLHYILEVVTVFIFMESLYWAHLIIINAFLPKISGIPVLFRNIIELLAVWMSGVLCSILFHILPLMLIYGERLLSPQNALNLRTVLLVGPIISLVLYYFVERAKSRNRLQEEKLRISKLEKENYQAQLQALKSQVSPHFLFNNLNVLASIIPEDSEKALRYTHSLSDLYRYYLQSAQEDLITLEEELKNLNAFQFLLKSRLGDQLKFSIENSIDQTQNFYLPPLVLQECIENAVKHNKATKNNPLHIKIKIEDERVWVSNNKALKLTHRASTQTGWKNIKKRYDLLGNMLPKVKENENTYKVILPMLKQN